MDDADRSETQKKKNIKYYFIPTDRGYEGNDKSEIETKMNPQVKKKKNIKFYYFLDDEIKIKKTNIYHFEDYIEEYIEENMMNIKELKSKKLKIQNNNIYERIEGDITYLENGNVKFNEDIYLNTEIMKGDDEKEIYVKCGTVFRHNESEEIALYLVKGMLFQE